MITVIDRDIHQNERFEYDGDVVFNGKIGRDAQVLVHGSIRIKGSVEDGAVLKTLTLQEVATGKITIADREMSELSPTFKRSNTMAQNHGITVAGPIGNNVTIDSCTNIELQSDAGDFFSGVAKGKLLGQSIGALSSLEGQKVELEKVVSGTVRADDKVLIRYAGYQLTVNAGGEYLGLNVGDRCNITARQISVEKAHPDAILNAAGKTKVRYRTTELN